MAYKILITGIREPEKVQELILYLGELTRLQPKTIAANLKSMPYELPIFQDSKEMKAAYTRLLNVGAAIDLVELKDSLLPEPDPDNPRSHEPVKIPQKVPRAPFAYKLSKNKVPQKTQRLILLVFVGLVALIVAISMVLQPESVPKKKAKKTIGVSADKAAGKQKGKGNSPAPEAQIDGSQIAQEEASKSEPPSIQEELKKKTQVVKPIQVLPPSSQTGKGIPQDIDPNTNEGRFHLARLREAKASELVKKSKGKSVQEKIALLKKSLNLDPYNSKSWNDLKQSMRETKDFDELKKVEKLEQKLMGDSQSTLEEISRSIGGVSTQVNQSLSAIEFKFSKTYTQGTEFVSDAEEVFKEFRIKYPDRRFVIQDPTGKLKIQVAAGEEFPVQDK